MSFLHLLFIWSLYWRFISLFLCSFPNRYFIFVNFFHLICFFGLYFLSFFFLFLFLYSSFSLSSFSLLLTLPSLFSYSLLLLPYYLFIFPFASLSPLANLSITFANHLIHHSSSHLDLIYLGNSLSSAGRCRHSDVHRGFTVPPTGRNEMKFISSLDNYSKTLSEHFSYFNSDDLSTFFPSYPAKQPRSIDYTNWPGNT